MWIDRAKDALLDPLFCFLPVFISGLKNKSKLKKSTNSDDIFKECESKLIVLSPISSSKPQFDVRFMFSMKN